MGISFSIWWLSIWPGDGRPGSLAQTSQQNHALFLKSQPLVSLFQKPLLLSVYIVFKYHFTFALFAFFCRDSSSCICPSVGLTQFLLTSWIALKEFLKIAKKSAKIHFLSHTNIQKHTHRESAFFFFLNKVFDFGQVHSTLFFPPELIVSKAHTTQDTYSSEIKCSHIMAECLHIRDIQIHTYT